MGRLVNGEWTTAWYDTESTGGEFVREDPAFRDWITPDGSGAPAGRRGYPAQPGRYHLYISYACPWASRTLMVRKLKGLEDLIGLSVTDAKMLEEGWTFSGTFPENHDPVHGEPYLYRLYQRAKSDYTGRCTVPLLWDRKQDTIVSNESADIIRMFNSAFDEITGNRIDLCPEELRDEIDQINDYVYANVNNGVYRCGFATQQKAYENAYDSLFEALDMIEDRLTRQRYLVGNRFTEADVRLFTTLVRFDAVYYSHFKCNRNRIDDFPHLSNYLRDLYQTSGIAETVFMDHIKTHYYYSHETINPCRIVPKGPRLDFDAPHDRDRVAPAEPMERDSGRGRYMLRRY
jgi:glutathionyl-hydroquinone reductase